MNKPEEILLLKEYNEVAKERNDLMELLNDIGDEILDLRFFSIKGSIIRKFYMKYMYRFFDIVLHDKGGEK